MTQIFFPPELCNAHKRTILLSLTSFPKATMCILFHLRRQISCPHRYNLILCLKLNPVRTVEFPPKPSKDLVTMFNLNDTTSRFFFYPKFLVVTIKSHVSINSFSKSFNNRSRSTSDFPFFILQLLVGNLLIMYSKK